MHTTHLHAAVASQACCGRADELQRYTRRIGGSAARPEGVSGGRHPEGRAARLLAWVGYRHRFEGRWRPLRTSTTCTHLGHRAAPLREKLATCVGSAGLGACVCGQIDVRMMLYKCKHFAIKMWLGVADF